MLLDLNLIASEVAAMSFEEALEALHSQEC